MPSLSESERLIADSALAFADKLGGIARARRLRDGWPAFDRTAWQEMAKLGWFAMLVPEAAGGLGLDMRAVVALLEQTGRHLLPEPVVPASAAAMVLARCHGGEASRLASRLLSGTSVCVPVPLAQPVFVDGHGADTFLVEWDQDGRTGFWIVPRDTAGLAVELEETVDGGSIGRLGLDEVDTSRLTIGATGEEAHRAFADVRDVMRLGYAALLLGLSDAALALTVEYMRTRRQFGVPIGTFQALQHRAASLYVDITSLRALLYEAAEAVGTVRQAFAAAAAKGRASEVALRVVKECVQFHGAIGFTDECDIGLFFRRAMALAAAGGDARACRRTITECATR